MGSVQELVPLCARPFRTKHAFRCGKMRLNLVLPGADTPLVLWCSSFKRAVAQGSACLFQFLSGHPLRRHAAHLKTFSFWEGTCGITSVRRFRCCLREFVCRKCRRIATAISSSSMCARVQGLA